MLFSRRERTHGTQAPVDRPRLLIVSQVYRPSNDAISQILADLAEDLAECGIAVHVLTSGTSYLDGARLPLRERLDGVEVWRTPAIPLSKGSMLGRLLGYTTFLPLSWAGLRFLPRPDVVMYISTPPFLGLSAGWVKRKLNAKTCYVAQDVYPEVAAAAGYLSSPAARRVATLLDRKVLAQYDRIVALGARMAATFSDKGVPAHAVSVIPNWCDERIEPTDRATNALLGELGLQDRFVVQYSGNMGVAHDMQPIVGAARLLEQDGATRFLIIGGGRRKEEVEQAVHSESLSNVILLPYQPRESLPVSICAADVALVSLRPEFEGLIVPSKLYGILAAGVPVVFIGDPAGEVARVLEAGDCGATVQTDEELAKILTELRVNAEWRRELGRNARRLYEQEYGRQRSVQQYADLVRVLSSAPA
jgi:colanic acid biosynthesis glycosyl transferase WcaI